MQQQTFPRWVDVLFSRLHVRYGAAWLAKWEGIDVDAVKADWHEQLATIFERNPQAIAYGLQNLPTGYPPNSDQFARLCTQQPPPVHQSLPAPEAKPNPAFAAEVIRRIEEARKADPEYGLSLGEICARRLEAKIARGEKLSYPQRFQLDAIRRTAGISDSTPEERQRVQDAKDAIQKRVNEYAAKHGIKA